MNLTKKALAVLLALVLLIGAAPAASASPADEGWLLYTDDAPEACTVTILAPTRFTRAGADPRVEAFFVSVPDDVRVLTAETEQLRFWFGGGIGTRLALTVVCPVPDGVSPFELRCAVLPGSVTDDAGNGNARVYFDDETDYLSAGGYVEIGVYSSLLRRDYDRYDDTVAVGDTLRVDYSGLYPVEILINGEAAASFPRGEMQRFTLEITETGALTVAVMQNGREILSRSLTVITSREMYERNLRDGLITGDDIPDTDELVDVGLPAGSPFIPLAKIVAFFVLLREFFQRLFSFTRVST